MIILKEINKNKKIYNGIELLRFLFCLWIVIIHCSDIKIRHKKYLERGFHVPTFFVISFYFFYPQLRDRIITKIITRFERLLYPYILWPIIILILNNVLLTFFKIGEFDTKISLHDFYIQIILGARYHVIFWFQFNIIFISLILSIISFICKDNTIEVIEFLSVICLYLHFSRINYNIFISFKKIYQITLGCLIELSPLAIIGCLLSSINLLVKIQIYSHLYYFILFLLIIFLFKYNIFIFYSGFMYPNIFLNIFASITLFICFGSLNIKQIIIAKLIVFTTKFTGGIYCIHSIFRCYFQKYLPLFYDKSYYCSFLIYIICYITCYIGTKLFQNYKLKYLFI